MVAKADGVLGSFWRAKTIFQHVETDRPGAEQDRRRVGVGFFQGDHRKEQHEADQRVDGERPAREHARREDLTRLRRMQPIDEALRCADRACVKLHKPHGQCAEHEREHGVREIVCGERNAAEQHRERGRNAERTEQRPVPVGPGLDGFPECGAGSSRWSGAFIFVVPRRREVHRCLSVRSLPQRGRHQKRRHAEHDADQREGEHQIVALRPVVDQAAGP